jgi:Aldo/keto reductase family
LPDFPSRGLTINWKLTEDQNHDRTRQSSLHEVSPWHEAGAIPALGFGTLIPDPIATQSATRAALEAGFRALDTAERYRTEKEVGEAMQEVFKAGKTRREDVFVSTKLWNTNHRPERVKPAMKEISGGIKTRQRFNAVVETGVPGFIPRGK